MLLSIISRHNLTTMSEILNGSITTAEFSICKSRYVCDSHVYVYFMAAQNGVKLKDVFFGLYSWSSNTKYAHRVMGFEY